MQWVGKMVRRIESSLYGAVHGADLIRENEDLKAGIARLQAENSRLRETLDLMARSKLDEAPAGDVNPYCPLCAGGNREMGDHSCLVAITNRVYMEWKNYSS